MGPHARRGGQQNPQGRFPPAHPRIFHGEIQELSYALEMERAGRVEDNQKLAHLEAELEETKFQLKKQKTLKETLINQAKEAKRELERLEKFSDPAVLNAAAIASKVHNDVKYMKKKNLQEDFEELKVAHLLSREAFVAEIQAERKKSLALQEELNQLQTSYEELRSQYEADDALLRQEAETQKYDEARLSEEQRLLENLRAEKDEMYQEMSQTITFLQGSEKRLQEELTQLKCSYNELNCKYERDVSGLKQDVDRYQEEVRHATDANIERDNENLQLINKLRAEKEELLQKMSGEIETYQHQVEQERKAHLEKTEEDKKLLDNMRAEKEELLQKMSGEISIRQKREKQMLHELDQIHTLYEELKCRYERDIMDIQQQVETYEQKIYNNDLQRERDDLLLADTLRAEEEDFQQQPITVSQEKEEDDSQNQVKVLNQEVSSEEGLAGEPLPGSSTDPESSEETEVAGETILEDLDDPDGKRKKSKISFWKKVRNFLRCKKPKKETNE
ncbi:trichohyalin-like [Xiphophorus hellerii]|uniref:trichohyalin-like n=1 Tax=Xiphophorus hellerii TaxID=8084 RepID=UPI0013B3E686|nr:trichohyalin-like [Xiphophorus hellerii]